VGERHFTRAEVEALIPVLTELVDRLRAAHAEVQEIRGRLQAEHQRLTLVGGGLPDQGRWRADHTRLEAMTKEAQAVVDELHGLGGVPKDVGLGLVDFPHLRDGRLVNLCWKYGETRIGWWHGFDEGYTARKPL
jgi:hypothetical protein